MARSLLNGGRMLKQIAFGSMVASLACGCGSSDGASGSSQPATDLTVTLGGAYDTYPHKDALSGQTAQNVTAGVRSLKLMDDAGGEWTLLDATPGNVSVSYAPGGSSTLGTIKPADVRAGHYTKARLVQDWSRFDVAATLHEPGLDVAGTLRALQITSEGATVEGKSFEQGHYEQTFIAANVERPYSGTTPLPDHSTTAEAEAFIENGEWAVYFPLDLQIAAGAKGKLAVRVNLDQAFRWTDIGGVGYGAGVYDITPPFYEPVEQFGGNRFDVSLE